MPERIEKYSVFIASPSDVEDDKQSIDEVIQELNQSFGKQNGLILETMYWEKDSAPGISQGHVQNLISDDIGDSYDLFIGLMGGKFGTQTDNAESGTEEEYNRAVQRFRDAPSSLQVLFYFKTSTPENIFEIDAQELIKVNVFRKNLKEQNVLYWEYNSIESLHAFLRWHIPKSILELKGKKDPPSNDSEYVEIEIYQPDEDLGFLDFSELSEAKFEESTTSLKNITQATEWISERITEKANEINIVSKLQSQPDISRLKKIFKMTAQVMNQYASRLDVETSIFFISFEEAIKATSSMINLADDFFNNENIQELVDSKESIDALSVSIISGMDGMTIFLNSVKSLPRIEKEINKAKRNLIEKLESFISKMSSCSELSDELSIEISEKIDRIG